MQNPQRVVLIHEGFAFAIFLDLLPGHKQVTLRSPLGFVTSIIVILFATSLIGEKVMGHTVFEGTQSRAEQSAVSGQSDTGAARLLAEVQTYFTNATNGSAAANTEKSINKDVDQMMAGFSIVKDQKQSEKSEIACRLMKGQTIEDGRLVPSDKDADAKPSQAPGRDGPTDQDRPSSFDLYLWNLCHPKKTDSK